MSYLALFQPIDVIDKLVESVLKNKGHVDCIVKLLHQIPALTRIGNPAKHLAVLSSVQKRLPTVVGRELQNITNFCRQLIVVGSLLSSDRKLVV